MEKIKVEIEEKTNDQTNQKEYVWKLNGFVAGEHLDFFGIAKTALDAKAAALDCFASLIGVELK